jgi:hypothetical protein
MPSTHSLERSTTFVDHTFVKGNSDNSYPVATYTVASNNVCGTASPYVRGDFADINQVASASHPPYSPQALSG